MASRGRRRWLRRALVVLAALLLAGGAAVAVQVARVPQDRVAPLGAGSLRVASDAVGRFRIGGGASLVVGPYSVAVLRAGRTVWRSPLGAAFVTAGSDRVGWREHRGYFWPALPDRTGFTAQRVDTVTTRAGRVRLDGALAGDRGRVGWSAEFSVRDGAVRVTTRVAGADSVALVSGRSRGAGVHGFGEQFAPFDLDGRVLPLVVREQGVGRGEQPLTFLADLTNGGAGGTEAMTYAAWPSYVTDDLRGVRLEPTDPATTAFALADTTRPGAVGVEVWSDHLTARLDAAATPRRLLRDQLADVAGRVPAVPDAAMDEAVVGLQGGTAVVRRRLAALEEAGARVIAVWLQDWSGRRVTSFGDRLWWTWQLDRERYPGWRRLTGDLRRRGIGVLTYVNPFLVDAAAKDDPRIRNLWADARDRGFLVQTADGGPALLDQGGFSASLVDLTNPAARRWFAGVIADEVLAGDVSGFMADFGEDLPFDARLSRGDGAALHNRWPSLWARTVRAGCRRAGKPDCVVWMRSGTAASAREVPLFWTGDQLVDYAAEDGLASALRGTLSAGVSGWPLVHSDLGGYTSVNAQVRDYVRGPDLLARWGEYAAFGVFLRSHEGNRPADNRQVYDRGERAAFARATRWYAALAPYRRAVVAEARATGLPAVRPCWLEHPGTGCARSDRQFLLGSALLIAPVLEEGAAEVDVRLPPGRWAHLLTGERVRGGRTVTVAAPVGRPAVFVDLDDPWAARLSRIGARLQGP